MRMRAGRVRSVGLWTATWACPLHVHSWCGPAAAARARARTHLASQAPCTRARAPPAPQGMRVGAHRPPLHVCVTSAGAAAERGGAARAPPVRPPHRAASNVSAAAAPLSGLVLAVGREHCARQLCGLAVMCGNACGGAHKLERMLRCMCGLWKQPGCMADTATLTTTQGEGGGEANLRDARCWNVTQLPLDPCIYNQRIAALWPGLRRRACSTALSQEVAEQPPHRLDAAGAFSCCW